MPKYRVISEHKPKAQHRESRGVDLCHDEARLVTAIESTNLFATVAKAADLLAGERLGRRIVSVEEIHAGFTYSDEEITHALRRSPTP